MSESDGDKVKGASIGGGNVGDRDDAANFWSVMKGGSIIEKKRNK